jgi:hypothetical protein
MRTWPAISESASAGRRLPPWHATRRRPEDPRQPDPRQPDLRQPDLRQPDPGLAGPSRLAGPRRLSRRQLADPRPPDPRRSDSGAAHHWSAARCWDPRAVAGPWQADRRPGGIPLSGRGRPWLAAQVRPMPAGPDPHEYVAGDQRPPGLHPARHRQPSTSPFRGRLMWSHRRGGRPAAQAAVLCLRAQLTWDSPPIRATVIQAVSDVQLYERSIEYSD